MNQTQNITVPHSKTYDITMTELMAAVTCILVNGVRGTSGIFRIHWRSCEAGRSYRWIYHWIYRHGSHCRTGYR